MSLLVWLPLNGNLLLQGLSGVNATMMGTGITYSTGKIGQAATFPNNCNSCIYLPRLRLLTGTYAAWIKVIGSGATARQCIISEGRDSSNDGVEIYTNQAGTSLNFKAHEKIITTTISLNQWYHVAGTFGNGEIKLYINGTLVGSNTYTADMSYLYALDLVLGKMSYSYTNTSNYFSFNGLLNDVRIYDHCLSSKEVEEISKGLVLHYKLDNYYLDNYFINPNLLLDTNVNGLTKVSASYNRYYESNGSGSYTCTWKAITDPPILGINYGLLQKVTTVSGFHSVTWYLNGYVSVITGTTYTMSCYVKVISGTDLSFKFQYGKSPYVANTLTLKNDNEWHQYSWTFTPNTASGQAAASGTTRIYCGGLASVGEVLICGWKLEEGNTATPWCETTYSPSNISNIVYDSSGYNNNGTIIDSLEIIFPSPRYNSAVLFNGSSSTIKVLENKWIALYAQAMTINLWAKNTTWSDITNMKFFSCTESGGFNCETGNSGYIRFPIHVCTNAAQTSYAYKYDSKEILASALIANEWNMITWVYDTSGTKTYINGLLHHTYTNTSYGIHFNTNARLFLGCEANTANPSTPYYNGLMSDFRMYYTALSPEAILELYNTSVTIDNKGNGYAREEIEDSNLNITKTGQFHNGELLDSNDYTTASITKIDKLLKVNNFYEY